MLELKLKDYLNKLKLAVGGRRANGRTSELSVEFQCRLRRTQRDTASGRQTQNLSCYELQARLRRLKGSGSASIF